MDELGLRALVRQLREALAAREQQIERKAQVCGRVRLMGGRAWLVPALRSTAVSERCQRGIRALPQGPVCRLCVRELQSACCPSRQVGSA